MDTFNQVCDKMTVPVAIDKIEGPATTFSYLGYTINLLLLQIQIPMEKVMHR